MVDQEGLRTFLAVPLFSGGQTVGSIAVYRPEVAPFSPDEIALVETFAAQAVIAIENVRQFAADATDAGARDRKRRHPAGHQPIDRGHPAGFRSDRPEGGRTLRRELLHAGSLRRREPSLSAQHGFPAKGLAALMATYPMKRTKGSISFKAIDAGTVAHIEDAQSDSYFDASLAATVGFHHLMGVPIRSGGRIWGVIGLGWPGKKAPTSADVELIQTFADQASIAIENARLFTEVTARTEELTEALEQQTATAELLKVISRSVFDLPTVLQAVIETAARLCDATICILFNRIGDAMHMGAHVGCSPEMVAFHQANPNPIDRSNVVGPCGARPRDHPCARHHAGSGLRPDAVVEARRLAVDHCGAAPARGRGDRGSGPVAAEDRALQRPPDRIGRELRRTGSHRHQQREPVQRGAGAHGGSDRGAGIPDRHFGRAGRDLALAQ